MEVMNLFLKMRHYLCPFSGYAVWDTLSHVWHSAAAAAAAVSAARVVQQASLVACALGRAADTAAIMRCSNSFSLVMK